MEFIVIHKRDGSVINTYNRVDTAEQVKEFLGQDVVNISLRSPNPIRFDIGDWVDVFGERYTLNILPRERKVHDRLFEYDVRFEGIQYDLIKVQLLDIDDSGFSTGANFSLVGNLEDYVKLIIRNLNRVYGAGSWVLGDVKQDTEYISADFTNNNCLEALQRLADMYETHFWIDNNIGGGQHRLSVADITISLPDTFRYGRHKGLYSLERSNVNEKGVVTRLYAFGGTQNIPSDYRGGSSRLKMPSHAIWSESQPFITDSGAVSDYGIVEAAINYDSIFPRREGVVSGIGSSRLVFYDSLMPFNLNAQLMPGLSAKVNFKTGALAGYTFEVANYNHATKEFTIAQYTDERGFVFPSVENNAFRIAAGDKYVLVDVKMPSQYVTAAELELLNKAMSELEVLSVPAVQWSLEVDANFLKTKELVPGQIINYFNVGHFLHIVDEDLKIDGKAQVTRFTRNILKPYEYELTVDAQFVNRRRLRRRDMQTTEGMSRSQLAQYVNNLTSNILNTSSAGTANSSTGALPTVQETSAIMPLGSAVMLNNNPVPVVGGANPSIMYWAQNPDNGKVVGYIKDKTSDKYYTTDADIDAMGIPDLRTTSSTAAELSVQAIIATRISNAVSISAKCFFNDIEEGVNVFTLELPYPSAQPLTSVNWTYTQIDTESVYDVKCEADVTGETIRIAVNADSGQNGEFNIKIDYLIIK